MNITIIGSGNVGSALEASFASRRPYGRRMHDAAPSPSRRPYVARTSWSSRCRTPRPARTSPRRWRPVIARCDRHRCHQSHQARHERPRQRAWLRRRGLRGTWLPGARLVKAFNTMFASIQGDPTALGVTVDALFATDDESARPRSLSCSRSMGFRPVYVGPLARAHELEAIAYLNITLQLQPTGTWRTAVGLIEPPLAAVAPERRQHDRRPSGGAPRLPTSVPRRRPRKRGPPSLPTSVSRRSTWGTARRRCSTTPSGPSSWGHGRRGCRRPTSILIVSAHWESAPITLGATTPVPLTYDFYGFPRRYYEQRYDAPGAPELAATVRALMPDHEPVGEDPTRGLDHGAYVPHDRDVPRGGHPGAPDVDARPRSRSTCSRSADGWRRCATRACSSWAAAS